LIAVKVARLLNCLPKSIDFLKPNIAAYVAFVTADVFVFVAAADHDVVLFVVMFAKLQNADMWCLLAILIWLH